MGPWGGGGGGGGGGGHREVVSAKHGPKRRAYYDKRSNIILLTRIGSLLFQWPKKAVRGMREKCTARKMGQKDSDRTAEQNKRNKSTETTEWPHDFNMK